MKKIFVLLAAASLSLLVGCSSVPVATAPVGPNPVGIRNVSTEGGLRVYSVLEAQSDNQNQGGFDNPDWYQHTDYNVYTFNGRRLKYVGNAVGHYAQAPQLVFLPAGQYIVKARARDYLMVKVPVTIKPGQITNVHLDDRWSPSAGFARGEVVRLPNGTPVGWGDYLVK
jgi:hypothetical protein